MLDFLKKYSFLLVLVAIALYFLGRYLYAKPKYINGEIAPNFNAEMIDGSSFELNSLKGKYILLDFWGSWCGPCIQEIPNLRKLYEDFHDKNYTDAKGFDIVSVGIESDKNRWLNAIQRQNMPWQYHVSDFKNFDSPIAKAFGVRVIPTKFLINTEGVIMGVNLSFTDIEKLLKSKVKT